MLSLLQSEAQLPSKQCTTCCNTITIRLRLSIRLHCTSYVCFAIDNNYSVSKLQLYWFATLPHISQQFLFPYSNCFITHNKGVTYTVEQILFIEVACFVVYSQKLAQLWLVICIFAISFKTFVSVEVSKQTWSLLQLEITAVFICTIAIEIFLELDVPTPHHYSPFQCCTPELRALCVKV